MGSEMCIRDRSSPGLSYDIKFVHIGWELRSSLVGDTILSVQSEPNCTDVALHDKYMTPHLTYFPFLHGRTLTVPTTFASSLFLMGLDDFSLKIVQDPIFLAPVLTNEIAGRN